MINKNIANFETHKIFATTPSYYPPARKIAGGRDSD